MRSNNALIATVLMALLLTPPAHAQVVDPNNVLIKNVDLVEATESDDQVTVNILIRDGVLEVVTKDDLSPDESMTAVDASGGFLIGLLKIGEAPNFLILDTDPRIDFSVLLDSRAHILFAINEGKLEKNSLAEIVRTAEEIADAKEPRGWLAYTPPPMVLPTSYAQGDKWNQWESKYVSGIFLAGVVLDRQNWLSQDSASEGQVGDLEAFDGGEIRGLRFGVVGTLNFTRPWVYTIFAATNAFDKGFDTDTTDNLAIFDYRLDIPLPKNTTLSVGKQKEPISMEKLMSLAHIPMQERTTVSDAMLPSRNVGAVLSGNMLGDRMTWAGGIFNDWFDAGQSLGDSATQLVGRVSWVPFVSDDDSNLVHLGLGARYSNAKEGVRYISEPEFNQAPDFVDTDWLQAVNSMHYNLEASWRNGPYWLAAEYLLTNIDAPTLGDPRFRGYHITGSWIVTGEMRPYGRKNGLFRPVPVARSVYQGGKGAWELSIRWSSIDLTDGTVDGGENDIFSLGVGWWLSPIFNVNLNYRYITLDRFGTSGSSSGFMTRLVLFLE